MFSGTIQNQERELRELAGPWRTRLQLKKLGAKPRSQYDRFEFAVMGDCEPGRFWIFRALFNRAGVFSRQISSIQQQSADFSVQLGDMVSRGLESHYLRFFRQMSSLPIEKPYLTVIGNHDRLRPHGRSNSRLYRSLFGLNNYHFDHGGVRFVVLDSSSARLSYAQLKWLDKVLDSPSRKVIFTHIPPAFLELWGRSRLSHRLGGFSEGASEFAAIASRRKVDRVFMGHIHGFGVQDYGGVRYVLTGGGGSPLFPLGAADRFYHYLTVSVSPSGLSERVHTLEGESFAIPSGRVLLAHA